MDHREITTTPSLRLLCFLVLVIQQVRVVHGNPSSKPYIPFRTDPYDQPQNKQDRNLIDSQGQVDSSKIRVYEPEKDNAAFNDQCPLQFALGVSRRSHDAAPGLGGFANKGTPSTPMGIQQPPIIYPILPWQGPGRQVLYTTQYEHLDMLTPSKGNIQVNADGNTAATTDNKKSVSDDKTAFSKSFIAEGLVEHVEFPLLFESSAFQTSPVIGDVNRDGILDAILTDYHGGIYAIGLQVPRDKKRRYFHKTQVPRLYVRRQWMEAMVNETLGIDPYEAEKKAEEEEAARKAAEEAAKAEKGEDPEPKDESKRIRAHEDRPHDPYHSYFEYTYGASAADHEPILRGVTADVLGQDHDHVQGLEERRNRRVSYERKIVYDSFEEEEKNEKVVFDSLEEEEKQEKLVYDSIEEEKKLEEVVFDSGEGQEIAEEANHRRLQEEEGNSASEQEANQDQSNERRDAPPVDDVYWGGGDDVYRGMYEENHAPVGEELVEGIDAEGGNQDESQDPPPDEFDDAYPAYRGAHGGDDTYPRYDDYSRGMYDDYYGGRYNSLHEDYYDDKHYVRIPPHILCTPTLVEMPKLYSNNGETESLLFIAVSYYFDEDEYEGFFSYKRFENSDHGDETETQRGMYVANAIMMYHYGDSPRWGRQEHLDMSGDHSAPVNMTLVGAVPMREDNTKLGAFALSSPVIADIDGDGSPEVLMGTSMGFLYVLDARNLFTKENWPVQLKYGIESRVLVEDVRGDTNLEIIVADVGGNVYCLDHTGKMIWHRDLLRSAVKQGEAEVMGSSPMVLGDVDGDGVLDVVLLVKVRSERQGVSQFLFALSADTGKDLSKSSFPFNIWTKKRARDQYVGEDFVHESLPPALLVDLHGNQDHMMDYIRRNGTRWTKRSSKSNPDNLSSAHGGSSGGLHIVQPVQTHLVIIEGGSGCLQSMEIGEDIVSMVQADDVHGTNKLDLVVSTVSGNVVTLEFDAPFHPLNVWNGGTSRGRTGVAAHGYTASQGIFVHEVSRQFRDIFGVYVPVTFEIFDNRPNIQNEPDKRKYTVEIREGTSRLVFVKEYQSSGVFTERFFIPFGPGYYELSVILKTSHGLVYEDAFHIGYNVNYMDGFGMLLWLPLTIATVAAFFMGSRKQHWDADDYQSDDRNGKQGILGNLPD